MREKSLSPVAHEPGPDGVTELPVVPRRHPWRWVGVVAIAFFGAIIVEDLVTNPNFEWNVVGSYFLDPRILHGLRTTIILTAVAMILAFGLGLVLAVMRLSQTPLIRSPAGIYIWLFRGTPVLVQLLFWYNLGALYPEISLRLPFGPGLTIGEANSIFTPWTAAIVGLALNEAAYLAEIIRSGIISVDAGQIEAARALGMNRRRRFRRIVLPQALRVMVPPISNEVIALLKYSSIVSVIALPELLYSGQLIYSRTFQTIPILIVVSLWYLIVTSVLTIAEAAIERRLEAGWTDGTRESVGLIGRWRLRQVEGR